MRAPVAMPGEAAKAGLGRLALPRRFEHRPGPFALALARRAFLPQHRLELYEQLALTMETGLREAEAITLLWRVHTRDGRRGRLHPLALFCRDAQFALNQEGRALPEVALGWCRGVERPLLVAAVRRGGTVDSWRDLGHHLRSVQALRRALAVLWVNALLLLVVVAGIGAFLAFWFLPAIADFVDADRLQGSARSLHRAALVFRDHWPLLAAGLAALLAGPAAALPRLSGPLRQAVEEIEPFRTYRRLTAGVFLAGITRLLRSGATERQALALLRRHATPYLADRIGALERIDAAFGERLHRVEGAWPDHRVKIEGRLAAGAADPVSEYGRMSAALIDRSIRDCERLASASSWLTSFLLVAAILWILLATNQFAAAFRSS